MWTRDAEAGNIQACREFGMSFMAYAALGRGFLAGSFHELDELAPDDRRRNLPQFRDMQRARDAQRTMEEIAQAKSATIAQVSLAWLLAQGDDIVPIPGCKTLAHLQDNMGAIAIEFTADELARLNDLAPPDPAMGAREQVTGAV